MYDKNSESDYFFFPPPKSEYFFQQHWESEYFFRKKPFKLNVRSLTSALLIGTLLQHNGKKVEVISFVGQFRSKSVVIPSFRARHQYPYRYVGYRTRKMFVV